MQPSMLTWGCSLYPGIDTLSTILLGHRSEFACMILRVRSSFLPFSRSLLGFDRHARYKLYRVVWSIVSNGEVYWCRFWQQFDGSQRVRVISIFKGSLFLLRNRRREQKHRILTVLRLFLFFFIFIRYYYTIRKTSDMSADTSTTATSSQPSTDPEAARTAVQTDHRHHPIELPNTANVSGNIEIDTSAYPKHPSDQHGPASPEKVAYRSKN